LILDRFRMDEKVAVVTGGGRGIGAASALALAEAGADVALCARTRDQLEAVAAQIRALGRRAAVFPCDVNDTSQLEELVARTVDELGGIDVLINNAGGSPPRPFLDTSEQMFEKAFHFNVTTAFSLSRLAAPAMLERGGGSIVNISSAMGRLSDRGYIAYGTAKAALSHMTRLMARDLKPRIRVNALAVGSVETAALKGAAPESVLKEMAEKTPLGRLGQPDDIAIAVLYLASDAGSWVTGKIFEIDGGIETPNFDLRLPDL
jgi:7-alpha-hydroxysteroid dehydrogenase